LKSQNLSESALDSNKEPTPAVQTNGDVKLTENGSVTKSDVPKATKPVVVSDKIIANGVVANGC